MTVKEVRQSYGSWSLYLRPYTPREIIDKIQANPFGHIAVVPGRVNPAEYGDGLLSLARYAGVFRSFFNQSDDHYEIKGTGMAFWLGDEDGKGDVYESPVTFASQTFPNTIRGLLPAGGAITEGTLYSVPGGQLYSGTHKYQSPLKAITYVTDTFSTPSQLVEWRVNFNGTLDAGPISNLYRMTPRAILVEKEVGREMELTGLQASLSNDYDVENYTTRVVLLGEGTGGAIVTGAANGPATPYKDIHGNPVKMTQIISESGTSGPNANIRAQVELNKKIEPRRASQINIDDYDVKGEFVVGDYIYVFDPDAGFIDTAQEAYWRGVPINPMKLRVIEMSWPIRSNWTVAFRTNNGEWVDLSEYYRPETGSTYVAVGDFLRTLAGPGGTEPVTSRPAADSSIPAAPVFTGLSTGSYQSGETNTTKSAIRAEWATPLNTDGSTVIDGDHYEIRYRTSQYIGYQVKWGQLSGYTRSVEDTFSRSVSGTWDTSESGDVWTNTGGAPSDYLTTGTVGRHVHTTTNDMHHSFIDAGSPDVDVTADIIIPITSANSGPVTARVVARAADAANYYEAALILGSPSGGTEMKLQILKRVGGSGSAVSGTVSLGTHVDGTRWRVRIQTVGSTQRAMAWRVTESPPLVWQVFGTDTLLSTGNLVALLSRFETGNTNALPQNIDFDNFVVVELTASAYKWGELSGNRWGAPVSEPVSISPEWLTAYVGWGTNAFTILELTPGMTYELQIRGVDNASPPHLGPWSGSSYVSTLGDIFPPSDPAAPVVASSLIAIQVLHNLGKNSGGTFNLENDLDHLDVHVGDSANFYPDTTNKVGELIAIAGMIQAKIAAVGSFRIDQTDNVWVKVVAVDRAGNKSGASPAVQSSATLIDDAHISNLSVSKVTAGTINAAWIIAGSIKTADSGARLELDGAGLRAYKSDGTQTVSVSSSTGEVEISGRLKAVGPFGAEAVLEPTTGGDDPYLRLKPSDDVGVEGHIVAFVSGGHQYVELSNVTDSFKVIDGAFFWVVRGSTAANDFIRAEVSSTSYLSLTSSQNSIDVNSNTYFVITSGSPSWAEIVIDGTVRLSLGGAGATITGSRGGNVALGNLLNELDAIGLINNGTTA